jgi:hypothetical protein
MCSLFDDCDFEEEINTIEEESLREKLHIVKNQLENYKDTKRQLYTY